jgi:Delta7-sterol 5-desaturase
VTFVIQYATLQYFHAMKELIFIWLLVFLLTSLRYVVFASAVYFPVYRWFRDRLGSFKIQGAFPKAKDYRREVGYSFSTFLVFGFTGLFIHLVRDHTQIYVDIHDRPLWWFFLSIPLALVVHDTYFYWTHRLMHHPKLFKTMHLTHHRSTNPSPWASFAFHPLEAVVESGILTVLVFLMPMHPYAILAFLLIMTAENVMGHLGYEFFPSWLTRSRIGKWLNTSTNHNMHHRYFEGNYGLYFRWWDIWLGTTHPRYDETLEEVQHRGRLHSAKSTAEVTVP